MDDNRLDQILDRHQGKAGSLIRVLLEIQEENKWLPREVLVKVSDRLEVPLSQVLQIVTFYKTFRLKPRGRHEIHVCMGTSCHVRGSQRILDKVQEMLEIRPGETDPKARFTLEEGNCLGCCTLGPEVVIDGTHHSRVTPDNVEDILKDYE
jgi:NADH-quinone oxidoreductase subunit E